jgi:hypothetical protein
MVALQKCFSAFIERWFEDAPSYIGEITLHPVDNEDKASLSSLRKSGIAISFLSFEMKSRHGMCGLVPYVPARYAVCPHFRPSNQLNVPASIWQLISFVDRDTLFTLLLRGYQSIFPVIWLLNLMPYLIGRASINSWWMPCQTGEGIRISKLSEWEPQYVALTYPGPIRMPGTASPLSATIQPGFRFTIWLFLLDHLGDRHLYGASTCLDCFGCIPNLMGMPPP